MATNLNAAQKRPILLLAQPGVVELASVQLAATGHFQVKTTSSVKEALTAIPAARPWALLLQADAVQPQHIVAARQLAELSASRKVPIVVFGGPLDAATEARREALGIVHVVDGNFEVMAIEGAIQAAIAPMEEKAREEMERAQQQREAQQARLDQQRKAAQIRERLAQAAAKLKPPPSYDSEPLDGDDRRKPFDAQALPQDDI